MALFEIKDLTFTYPDAKKPAIKILIFLLNRENLL